MRRVLLGIAALLLFTSCSDSGKGTQSHADVLAGVTRVCREQKALSSAELPSEDLSPVKRAAAMRNLTEKLTAAREDFFAIRAEDASDAALIKDLAQKGKALTSIDITKAGASEQQRQIFKDTRERVATAGKEFSCLNG